MQGRQQEGGFFFVEVARQRRVPAGIGGILSNISQPEPLGVNLVLSIIFPLPIPQPSMMSADIAGSHQQRHQGGKKGFIGKAEQLGNRLPQIEGKAVLVQIMQVAEGGKLNEYPYRQILYPCHLLILPEVKGKVLQASVIIGLKQL